MFMAVQALCGNTYPNVTPDILAYAEGTPGLIPKRLLAIVFFCETHLTEGIVAHEMLHVATYQMYRNGSRKLELHEDVASSDEEKHADILEDLVDNFYKQYNATLSKKR